MSRAMEKVKQIIKDNGRNYRLNNQQIIILNDKKQNKKKQYYSDDIIFEQNVYFFFWEEIKKYQKEIKIVLQEELNLIFEKDKKIRFKYDAEALKSGLISKSKLLLVISKMVEKYSKLKKIITDCFPVIIFNSLCENQEDSFLFFENSEDKENGLQRLFEMITKTQKLAQN